MSYFKSDLNFSEFNIKKNNLEESTSDPTKSLSDLPDGVYDNVLLYGYRLELPNGETYKCNKGVRNKRGKAKRQSITVKDGDYVINQTTAFSGLSCMGGVLAGASYGPKPQTAQDASSRVTVDYAGFNIPKDMITKKLTISQQHYSFPNDRLAYQGPQSSGIPVSKDPTIIRQNNNPGVIGAKPEQVPADQPKANDITLDWDVTRPFHLGIEPWITSPIISDTPDGIYIGLVSGDTFDAGKVKITLGIKLNTTLPEAVFGLVKNKKLYLFKQSQFINQNKNFSETSQSLPSSAQLFEIKGYDQRLNTPEELIGTLIFSVAIAHLYHLRSVDYAEHKALQKLYENLPDLTDNLAERILGNKQLSTYQVMLDMTPSITSLDFVKKLEMYVTGYRREEGDPVNQSIIDNILQLLGETKYKLKRLTDGKKVFSIVSDEDNQYFSNVNIKLSNSSLDKMVDSISDAIKSYFTKFKKSPIKEIKTNDKKVIKQYCKRKILSGEDISTLINAAIGAAGKTGRAVNNYRIDKEIKI